MHRCPICIKRGHEADFETAEALAHHRTNEHPEQENVAGLDLPAAGTVTEMPFRPPKDTQEAIDRGLVTDEELREAQDADLAMREAEEAEKRLCELETHVAALVVGADGMAVSLQGVTNAQTHLTSEIGAVRDSIARLAESAARTEQELREQAAGIAARLAAQEQQTFGERIRRLEEEAGFAPKRPEHISGGGAPVRPPRVSSEEAGGDPTAPVDDA